MSRGMRIFGLCLLVGTSVFAGEAAAQSRSSRSGDFDGYCRPPLKFAAGACVPSCPAGYEDRGRYCEYRAGGGGGGL
jgi:hypothetical protein